jgi:hypothetical protein
MKFFTLDIYHSPDNDARLFIAAAKAYERHLAGLRDVLPDELLDLANLPIVDDGLLVEARRNRSLGTLHLVLRCGNLQVGYYDLVLHYEGIQLSRETAWTLAQIARTTTNDRRHAHDVACHEVDRSETGGVEHRLLFNPGVVIVLSCQRLWWQKIDQPDRTLPALTDRFPEGPLWAAYHRRKRRLRAAPPR